MCSLLFLLSKAANNQQLENAEKSKAHTPRMGYSNLALEENQIHSLIVGHATNPKHISQSERPARRLFLHLVIVLLKFF